MPLYSLTDLADEVANDPTGRGYAAQKIAGSASGVAALLNANYAGVGPVFRTNVKAADILAAITFSELSAFTTNDWLKLNTILLPGVVDASKGTVRAWFTGMFPSATFPLTSAALTALAKITTPTRAEERWFAGIVVPASDIASMLQGVR